MEVEAEALIAVDRAHEPFWDFFWYLGAEPLVSSFGGKSHLQKQKEGKAPSLLTDQREVPVEGDAIADRG